MNRILIVEDDVAFCNMLQAFLTKKGFDVEVAYQAETALQQITQGNFSIILTDVRLPEKDGTAILEKVVAENMAAKVILMTGYAEVDLAVAAIKKGAFDYISKPVSPDKLLETIQKALQKNPKRKTARPKTDTTPIVSATFLKGVSDASLKLDDYIRLVAPTDMSVLITGESGTGKEYAAKSIHQLSKRKDGPFVPVDCGAIPKEIASSEFFGHVKGSFTGAISDKTGHFEAANGGTLFLDEIGNLNYELQIQLLRALQERKIKPVGSTTEILVDIRVLTATNENLEHAVKKGDFREDLYHRLNEFSIQMPQLKDRKEDIVLFADHFLELANKQLDKKVVGLDNQVVEAFQQYSWPGNLREMQNCIKRAVLLCTSDFISRKDVPKEIFLEAYDDSNTFSLYKNKNEMELILEALEQTDGNKSKAAKLLDIDRKTLYNKLKQYGIKL